MNDLPVTLFCLPYAGGNAHSYRPLTQALSSRVQARTLELPGRGVRGGEPLCRDMQALVNDVFAQLAPQAVKIPFALFGHSMGGLLAYLCALRLRDAGLPAPRALFVSAQEAPARRGAPPQPPRHLLPDAAFLEMLRALGGCPDEVLAEPQLMAYFTPILRADFQAVDGWRHRPHRPLDVPLTVLLGEDDCVCEQAAAAWAEETHGRFALRRFPGGHFYIQQHWSDLAELIAEQLAPAPRHAQVERKHTPA